MALAIAPGTPSVASTAIDSDTDPNEEVQDLHGQSCHEVPIDVGSDSEVEMAEPPKLSAPSVRSAAQRQTSLLHWTAASQPGAKKPKLLTAREATQRRRERRERASALRFWELRLPPPVVGYDLQVERLCLSTNVNGLDIHFPLEPLSSQLRVVAAAAAAMEKSTVALVESPTGTGKTLALLSACLAFQWHRFKAWQDGLPARKGQDEKESESPVPRVVWIARTHDQLEHAIRELRRLPYRPLESLRISRERFCLHPFVQQAQDKSTACEMATMTRNGNALGGGQSGCVHLDNAEAIGYPTIPEHRAKFETGGKLAVYDIEDLVKEGHETQTCPYHASMDLTSEGAALVLCTYPQIMDPCVRESSNFEQVLQDAVVVVDEAHNLPQVARDAASFRGGVVDFEQLMSKLQGLAKATAEQEAVQLAERVCGAVTRLRDWLAAAAAGSTSAPVMLKEMGEELRDVGGRGCLALVSQVAGLQNTADVQKLLRMLQGLRRRFIDHGLEGWAVRSSAVNEMDSFLRKMSLILEEGGQGSYTLTVSKAGFGQRGRLSMVALSGAIAFQGAVARCRSVIFASGTLAPFALFKRELGLGQEATIPGTSLFTRPVVADEVGQCSSVTRRLKTLAFASLEGQKLSSTRSFRAQQLPQYLTALGKIFRELLPVVPHGKLLFFPSHEQLNDAVSHWRTTGLLERHQLLGLEKFCGIPVVVESSGLSSEAAASLVSQYRQLAAQPAGAVLLAVMRGRCAEGADFKDDAARAVVVVGVPFPSMDTEVKLKMEYEGHNGSAWYEAEAYRSVSQAAGRLLRHQNDYGALLLLDGRFTSQPAQLSGWLRHELRQQSRRGDLTMATLRTIAEEMTHFFLRNDAAEVAVNRPKKWPDV